MTRDIGKDFALLTFPGIVLHEFSHKLFCDWTSTKVHEVCYFQLAKPIGFVSHEQPKNLKVSFLISIAPIIINTVVCSVLSLVGFWLKRIDSSYAFLFLWLGISAGINAFPSDGDAINFVKEAKAQEGTSLIYYVSLCFSFSLQGVNALRSFWFDLIYAMIVAMALPLYLGILK